MGDTPRLKLPVIPAVLVALAVGFAAPASASFGSLAPSPLTAAPTAASSLAASVEAPIPSNGTRLSWSRTPTGPRPYFGARFYGSRIGRFTTIDPFCNWTENLIDPQRWNRYAYGRNNPMRYVDPDGRDTITAQDGTVVEVRNNGDLGVYRGKDRVGETAYWDEFRAHDGQTGAVKPNVIPGARIDFGSSWDAVIASDNAYADSLGLITTAAMSRNNGYFDIKADQGVAPYGVGTGRLLNGKYATAESAGNYLAGLNMATGTYAGGLQLTRDQGMKLAGALQQREWSKLNAAGILAFGIAFGPPP